MFRILGRRGYHTTQCTKPRKLGESVPDFKSTPVTHENFLHEQVEKVLFLWTVSGQGEGICHLIYLEEGRHLFLNATKLLSDPG
jgi:hypothetical protein